MRPGILGCEVPVDRGVFEFFVFAFDAFAFAFVVFFAQLNRDVEGLAGIFGVREGMARLGRRQDREQQQGQEQANSGHGPVIDRGRLSLEC